MGPWPQYPWSDTTADTWSSSRVSASEWAGSISVEGTWRFRWSGCTTA
ncbi:MAG: hypothetical protein U0W40_20425 [Acidimicrobiia bacterium]